LRTDEGVELRRAGVLALLASHAERRETPPTILVAFPYGASLHLDFPQWQHRKDEKATMGRPNFSDDLKRHAVGQIAERRYRVAEVSQWLGVRPHAVCLEAAVAQADQERDAIARRVRTTADCESGRRLEN
jgi:transposase